MRKCAGGLASLDTLERVYVINNGLSAEAGSVIAELLLAKVGHCGPFGPCCRTLTGSG